MSRARIVLIACAAVASLGLPACAESEIEPQTPENAQVDEHPLAADESVQNPGNPDGFAQVAEVSYAASAATPLPPPRESVSLGSIGDEPLGRSDGYALPSHAAPYWTRPFGTLPQGAAPYPPACYGCLRPYDAPLYPYYAPPPIPPTPY